VRKTFVIDTSVLLYDKDSIRSFPGNDVVIPLIVLDELDRNKEKPGIVGENARHVNRYLDGLREHGRLDKGVKLPEADQTVQVFTQEPDDLLHVDLDFKKGDNRIIAVALSLKAKNKRKPIIVVTKDINLRVKCDALGIESEDYYKDYINLQEDEDHVTRTILVSPSVVSEVYSQGYVHWSSGAKEVALLENEYVICKSDTGSSVLCRYTDGELRRLKTAEFKKIGAISPKNKEQHFALDALTDDSVSLVCLTGIAGSGKTFLTLMSALEGQQSGKYERIIVTRSIQPVGRDLGYLPGDIKEKMAPWMSPLVDNFRHAFKDMSYFEMMVNKGQIEISPLSYIRGRTFSNAFVIVDEAQNATIHELKTIITRVGENTKIVLMGDTDQVDTPYIDKRSNGLSIVINKMRDSGLVAHIHLPKGERSALATLASKAL
jgi:PhoH-like ATPase